MTKIIKVKGMDCPSCATLLECELEDAGIQAKVSFQKEIIETENTNIEKLKEVVQKMGYTL